MTMVTLEPISLRERKQVATRRSIVDAAVRLFSEKGLDGPTIADIASAAGVGKGTIYNYFASKEEIPVAYIVGLEEEIQGRLTRFAEAGAPLERILAGLLRFHFRLKRPTYRFNRVFLSQLILQADDLGEHIARMQEAINPPLLALFGRLQERGLIHRSLDLRRAVLAFKQVHFGLSCLWAMEGPPFRGALRAVDEQMAMFARWLERRP
jgi:AcrR family transcriptional regulator